MTKQEKQGTTSDDITPAMRAASRLATHDSLGPVAFATQDQLRAVDDEAEAIAKEARIVEMLNWADLIGAVTEEKAVLSCEIDREELEGYAKAKFNPSSKPAYAATDRGHNRRFKLSRYSLNIEDRARNGGRDVKRAVVTTSGVETIATDPDNSDSSYGQGETKLFRSPIRVTGYEAKLRSYEAELRRERIDTAIEAMSQDDIEDEVLFGLMSNLVDLSTGFGKGLNDEQRKATAEALRGRGYRSTEELLKDRKWRKKLKKDGDSVASEAVAGEFITKMESNGEQLTPFHRKLTGAVKNYLEDISYWI